MNTSRLQYIDRGAMGANDMPSECRTPVYIKDGVPYVPTFKRLCVASFTGKPNDYVLTKADSLAIANYIHSKVGYQSGISLANGFDIVSRVAGMLVGKRISEIPEHDPSFTPAKPPDKIEPDDPFTDIMGAFKGLSDIATFLTDPSKWLAMLAMLIGFGLLGFAVFKGISNA